MTSAAADKPLWQRLIRQWLTLVFTLFMIGIAIGLMILGQSVLAERAAAVTPPQAAPAMHVQTDRLVLSEGYEVPRRFPGQIEAAQHTVMAFEQGGTIAHLAVDEGDRMTAGTVIARLDTRLIDADRTRLMAARRALEAQAELAKRTTRRQTELSERGFASLQAVDNVALRLAELEARIAEIDASLVSVDLQLEKSELRAPFDAMVSTRMVDTGSAVGSGQPVFSLVQASGQQFRVGLTPDALAALTSTNDVAAIFGNKRYPLRLNAVLPELDSATRTRTVLLDFVGSELPPLRDTGALVLTQMVTERGAWVPLAALQDAPRGLWRLMTVTDDGGQTQVQAEAVEVLFSDAERAYVRGTFREGMRYITDGPHRVVSGQTVSLLQEAG
ncbi:efflux RND transporter periplasmic adaptor subunit [Roseobacter sp. YSTF-M11]|uniref:Efflux RND transporter periplasmic adaptor subunit n=1 Tax=Roseobacter insulae TaxID=2859783 RepID=A0A9X1K0G1_9RHOB|nr:efflux RND transporter periplasmic adaptor subunit [Roseobacter insulae]MBW4708134.1 efflux RND transporter periplasmic adaptor subunit [Roseobacter insulae]